MSRQKLHLADVLFACQAVQGNISKAADRLGCARYSLQRYLKRHPSARRAFDEWRERLLDMAEQALWECVTEHQAWAISLVLCRLGRHRGYGEKPREAIDREGGITLYWDDQERPTIYLPHKDPLPEDLEARESATHPAGAQASSDEDAMPGEVRTLMAQMQALLRQLERSRDGTSC